MIGPGLLLGLCLLLAACGFQPLYGRGGDGPTTTEEMAATRILPMPDRVGQIMHNMLRDRLNPRGQPRAPAYLLRVSLGEVKEELGVRKDETATRANLTLSASFSLHEAATDKVLFSGFVTSINSYNILENQFATIFSESDARERALRELSDDIRIRLGVYFTRTAKADAF
jgi:LPS-assembly lipoprotein